MLILLLNNKILSLNFFQSCILSKKKRLIAPHIPGVLTMYNIARRSIRMGLLHLSFSIWIETYFLLLFPRKQLSAV